MVQMASEPISPIGTLPSRFFCRCWPKWYATAENPAMFFDGSTYLLAYSAGHWETGDYLTGLARCASPAGPSV